MVPWPGKLELMRRAVERQEDNAAAELAVRTLDLRLEAKRGWFMLLLNAKRREVSRAARSLAATIAGAALGRYVAGQAGHHDVARAQLEVAALDVELVNLEGERTSMIAMLNALRDRPMDAPIAEPIAAPSPAPIDALAALQERASAQRPELQGMGAMRAEAQAMAALSRKEPYPDLMGGVWLNQNIGAPASFGAMLGGTIPLFGAAKQRHRAAAFDARAEGAAQDQAAMRAMIRYEVAAAFNRVQTATRELDLLRATAVPKARESFEAALAGYGTAMVELVGVLLSAPRSGVVVAKQAIEGMFVDPAVELYTISDLSRVWVLADVYESDVPYVQVGSHAHLNVQGREDVIPSAVTFLPPTLDEATRTMKMRFELDNADGSLRPGAFVSVTMDLSLGKGLAVPERAVIRTGTRAIVFVVQGDRAEPREVKLGPLVGDRYRIDAGLSAGESVATGAQFLLDSESRLQATSAPKGGHVH
jgi:RND family efflux transporter MFP subunit